MNPILISLAAGAAAAPPLPPEPPPDAEEIVVTGTPANRESGSALAGRSAQAATPPLTAVLGLPLATDWIRLLPGVSVATAGPSGSQTQVRLRGAEANHTLLVVDGIRFNDPAAGNEARFELLSFDVVDRLTLYLGPRSALWGSEAIGGVLAADTLDPYIAGGTVVSGRAEYGSLDGARVSASVRDYSGKVRFSGASGWMRSDGIDSFGTDRGERDGFANRSANAQLVYAPVKAFELGIVGHWIEGESEYDGFDPATFRRGDTLDETRNRIAAVRGWAKAGAKGWTVTLDGSLLASANRNLLAGAPLNRTFGRRFTTSAKVARKAGGHLFTAATEHQSERFRARDDVYFGATRQDRSRELTAFIGEWEGVWSRKLTTELAVRHDRFSAFADATTVRAGVTWDPTRRLQLFAGYGDGIAQPTFYDLYGFFPGSFTGNPALKPERSRGWNASIRLGDWYRKSLTLGYFDNRLKDEIVDVFDPATFLSTAANAGGASRRRGIEASLEWRPNWLSKPRLNLNYTYLDAEERPVAPGLALREVRRPRHSAGFIGQGEIGRLLWSATLAYVVSRRDTDFESFPARPARLDDYMLGSLQLGYRFATGMEIFARAQNALDADYQDVFGYRTEGRTVHAGLRLRLHP